MVVSHPYVSEIPSIWFDKWRCEDAERTYQEAQHAGCSGSAIVSEIAKARKHIQNSLNQDHGTSAASPALQARIEALEVDNKDLRKVTDDLRKHIKALEDRMLAMERAATGGKASTQAKPAAQEEEDEEDDDDFDPFASEDEEDVEENERVKAERTAAYYAKKALSAKPAIIAKSSILLDVKPWDDETDMKKLEECVRSVQCEGLHWGASKFVPLAYGIKKLQILCTVVDDLVGTDFLEEEICAFEDYIQSVDVAAFNKI